MYAIRLTWLNELMLMRLRKKTTLFIVLSACLPIVLVFSYHALQSTIGMIGLSVSFPIMMLSLYTLFWIPLFIFMTTADMFPSESAARTLKLTLLRPVTRFQAYSGKLLAAATAIALMIGILFLVTMACLYANLNNETLSAGEWVGYFKAYSAAFFFMMALLALFSWIAQWFHTPTGYLICAILFYAAAKVLPYFSSTFAAFSLTAYSNWYVLWLSNSAGWMTLLNSSLFICSGLIMFFSLGFLMFDRKEA